MNIVIIGSGNVATILGRKMKAAGHSIVQVYSRNGQHAATLASELNAEAVDDTGDIHHSAELYVVAVADNALSGIDSWLQLNDQLVVHTAGSVPIAALKNVSSEYGVLYPLQRMRKELDHIPEIPLLIDAISVSGKNRLEAFARTLSRQVSFAGDEARLHLHLAAVITSNFSNHLYALTEQYCRDNQVDFNMLLPLLQEVVLSLGKESPLALQTGPALRRDDTTIKKHRELLVSNPVLLKIYDLFTESIQRLS